MCCWDGPAPIRSSTLIADLDGPLTAEIVPLEAAYGLALENRPDIQSLQLLVEKADADVIVENRKKYPDVIAGLWLHASVPGTGPGRSRTRTR